MVPAKTAQEGCTKPCITSAFQDLEPLLFTPPNRTSPKHHWHTHDSTHDYRIKGQLFGKSLHSIHSVFPYLQKQNTIRTMAAEAPLHYEASAGTNHLQVADCLPAEVVQCLKNARFVSLLLYLIATATSPFKILPNNSRNHSFISQHAPTYSPTSPS